MPKTIRKIEIEFIPQDQMRYDTCGDWRYEGDKLIIEVAQMPELYQQAIAIHELFEALLCNAAGVTQEVVDEFDINGPGADADEPGFHPDAPYAVQHQWADVCERCFIAAVGLSWSAYDDAVSDKGSG
jgi:hypothetical protein